MRKFTSVKNRIRISVACAAVLAISPAVVFADGNSVSDLHAGVGAFFAGSNYDAEDELVTVADDLADDASEYGAGVHSFLKDVLYDEIITDIEQVKGPEVTTGADVKAAADAAFEAEEVINDEVAEDEGQLQDITEIEVSEDFSQITQAEPELVMANVEMSVNVRKEPNEDSEVVGKLLVNTGGELVEQRDGWTHIKSGKVDGWTKDEFLFFGEEAKELSDKVGKLVVTVDTDTLKIRMDMSKDAGVLGLAAGGDKLTGIEDKGEWVSVKYDGEVGYVSSDYVTTEFSIPEGKTLEELEAEEKAKAEAKAQAEKKAKSGKSKKGSSGTTNQGAVETAASDVNLLAALIQCEAGKESYEGQLAVGAVVMNRVRSGSYPGSVSAVITQPSQFPPATNGRVSAVLAQGPSSSCVQAAQAAISGQSNVGGATHFGTSGSGITIGNHSFW